MVRDAIQSQGHVVSVPSTIDRAVHLAKAHRPDVILLDLGIPGLLGWKALTAIRSEPTIRDIPTVILGCGRDGTVMSLHAALDAGRETARALIIEDEPDLRNELTTALTQRGIETMTADYASEAIEGLERFGPDLIVMGLSSLGTDWTPLIESILDSGRCIALAGAGDVNHPSPSREAMRPPSRRCSSTALSS